MNIAYFGSPNISAILLEKLIKKLDSSAKISVVVTQPPKPAGKRLEIQSTFVHKTAQQHEIPVFDLEIASHQDELKNLLKKNKIELCVVFAFGEFISNELLNYPKHGFWNVHPSLLPLYRGPSPIIYPIMLGDKDTGTSLIKLSSNMDGGPIISQKKAEIDPAAMRSDIELILIEISVNLVANAIKSLIQNEQIDYIEQNHEKATVTRLLKKEDGYIDINNLQKALSNELFEFKNLPELLREYLTKYDNQGWIDLHNNPGRIIFDYYRALYPWPGLWTTIKIKTDTKRLKINKLKFINEKLIIEKVQLEGKNEIDFTQFNKSYNIFKLNQ